MFGMRQLHGIHITHEILLARMASYTGVVGFFFGDGTNGSAAVIVAGINQARVGKRENLIVDGVIQRGGIALLKIRSAAPSDQKRVAGEGFGLIIRDVGEAAAGMSGGSAHLERVGAKTDTFTVGQRNVYVLCADGLRGCNLASGFLL